MEADRLSVKNITESDENVAVPDIVEVTYANNEISQGKNVTMHFSLAFKDRGEELIDSTFDKSPVSFVVGDGNLLAGFERALFGFKAGLKTVLNIPCAEAFGAINEDNIQAYPRYQFPADLLIEKGLMISFSDAAGNEQAGMVEAFDAENVTINFNHPLAGSDIRFEVEIIAVSAGENS